MLSVNFLKKQQTVSEIVNLLSNSEVVLFFKNQGLITEHLYNLRTLVNTLGKVKIYKNALFIKALVSTKLADNIVSLLEGPNISVCLKSNDLVFLKKLDNFMQEHDKMEFNVGYWDNKIVDAIAFKKLMNLRAQKECLLLLMYYCKYPLIILNNILSNVIKSRSPSPSE